MEAQLNRTVYKTKIDKVAGVVQNHDLSNKLSNIVNEKYTYPRGKRRDPQPRHRHIHGPAAASKRPLAGSVPLGPSSKCQESTALEVPSLTVGTLQEPRRSCTTHGETSCPKGSL